MLKRCKTCKEQFETKGNGKYCVLHAEDAKRNRHRKYYNAWVKRNRIRNNERKRQWVKENIEYIRSLE